MSSPTADEDAQIIAIIAASSTWNYISSALAALLVYEWVIGLGKEINLFWREKVTAATFLFILNRYAPLAYMVASFFAVPKYCKPAMMASIVLDVFQYVPWALFSGLRTYALCGKRWTVAIPVLVLSAVPIGINLTNLYWTHGAVDPLSGCVSVTDVPDNISFMFSIIPRSALIAADAIVVVVTWLTTYSSAVAGGFSHWSVPSIAQRLLVNGTIYFVILLILNALHLAFTLLSIANYDNTDPSYVISFTEPITAILVVRFMFDLQNAKQRAQHRSDLSDARATGFSRALGSIGSTLSTADVWRLGPGPGAIPYNDHAEGRCEDSISSVVRA